MLNKQKNENLEENIVLDTKKIKIRRNSDFFISPMQKHINELVEYLKSNSEYLLVIKQKLSISGEFIGFKYQNIDYCIVITNNKVICSKGNPFVDEDIKLKTIFNNNNNIIENFRMHLEFINVI